MSLSCAICELAYNGLPLKSASIHVKPGRPGHSGSLKVAQFDRSHTSSYWCSTVTMALPCIVS